MSISGHYTTSKDWGVPAPVMEVELFTPSVTSASPFSSLAIVDSGAHYCSVPEEFVIKLGLQPIGVEKFKYMDGREEGRLVYSVQIGFRGSSSIIVKCIASSVRWVFLGRNFLNAFRIILDGRLGTYEIE